MTTKERSGGIMLIYMIMIAFGCSVGNKYQQPELDLPDQYRGVPLPADMVSLGKTPLHQFFTDPLLQELIDSTIKKNFDILLAIKNIEISNQLLRQAKLGYWPDVDAQITAGTSRFSDNSINSTLGVTHLENYTASIGFSWEADIWGKIRMRKHAALSNYLQSEEVKKAVQTRLVAEVAQGYYNLLSLDAQLSVAQKNYTLRDSTLRILRLQYTAGQVTSLAVQQADAQKQVAALLVPTIQQERVIQENALRVLSGELPSAIELKAGINDFHVPEYFTTGVPVEMVGYRPDVRSFELALQAANDRVGIAKANMYPSLIITASGGLNSILISSWYSIPASLFGIASGSLTQPIFHRRELRAAYEIAKIDREKSVIRFRQSVLFAVEEVSDALIRVEKLKSQREIASARVNTLRNVTQNAMLLFKSGMANYLDVITAQATALQSQLDVVDIQRQQLSAYVELYRSLGGGWN